MCALVRRTLLFAVATVCPVAPHMDLRRPAWVDTHTRGLVRANTGPASRPPPPAAGSRAPSSSGYPERTSRNTYPLMRVVFWGLLGIRATVSPSCVSPRIRVLDRWSDRRCPDTISEPDPEECPRSLACRDHLGRRPSSADRAFHLDPRAERH
jgi:hypothetical protein